jgi:hypothetical protein
MIYINSIASDSFFGFILLLLAGMGSAAVRRSKSDDDVQLALLSSPRRWDEFKVLEGHTQPDNHHSPLPHE